MISGLIGGIGLFLLGMALMTDGVKSLAGDAARRALSGLAGGRMRAFGLGAAVTALLQSSSATTIMTIGFVSAGLLPLAEAIAVVIGANVGTTATGWIVALLGIKLDIGAVALPLVGVGALTKLFSRDRFASLGLAIAGFGLIFVGIGFLKDAMGGIANTLQPGWFALSGLWGLLALVGIGALMTVLTQSSSAAMATTLTALHSGAITLEQGAALAIGQNIGTTMTAAIAAMGAKTAARRTAAAHILFNICTGALALGLLWLLSDQIARIDAGPDTGTIELAAFHTAFNLLGAAIFLPLLKPFTWLVSALIRPRGPMLTRRLDRSVTAAPPVAIEASRRTARACLRALAVSLAAALREGAAGARQMVSVTEEVAEAVEETRRFVASVPSGAGMTATHKARVAVLHSIDHLERLLVTLNQRRSAQGAITDPELRELRESLSACFLTAPEGDDESADTASQFAADTEAISRRLATTRRDERPRIFSAAADGLIDQDTALRRLESLRWLDRAAYHIARTAFHLLPPVGDSPASPPQPDPPAPRAGELAPKTPSDTR